MADEIAQWLEGLGLGQYAQAFEKNYIDWEVLTELTEEDLEKIDVPLGHRKKLLKAISQQQEASSTTEAAALQSASIGPPVEAERRQLTVMFCDLVGSTALSSQLDPEDMRDVMRSYQNACAGIVKRYEGFVAKYMGDGVLVYFGYPTAHEDDAERAINAGLGIVEAVEELEHDLQVRIGIATGMVVVGDIVGEGVSREAAIIGETPNLAARLQEIAGPNMVVIAETTHRLAGGMFELNDLASHDLKGFAEPVQVWSVSIARNAESRFDATRAGRLTDLIGRDEEMEILLRRWRRAKEGEGQIVLISGEPGIGKSRLVRELQDRIAVDAHVRMGHQCSSYHANSALYPIIGQLERAAGFETGDSADTKLDKLEALLSTSGQPVENVAPLIGSLLSLPIGDRYPALNLTSQRQRELTLQALVDQLSDFAQLEPVLFIFEDAHWIDPTTLELLELTVERVPELAALVLVTHRPEFEAPWAGQPHVTQMTLRRLANRDCSAMVERVSIDEILPRELLQQIVAQTDGVPLFVEELTKSVLEATVRSPDRMAEITVPTTLQDSLEARLDRLGPAKEVAQIGAAIGRTFDYRLLSKVAPLDEEKLQNALDKLVGSDLTTRRGTAPSATYTFKHAMVQDTAYGSILRTRRKALHERIARALEDEFPNTVASSPEILAHHLTEAGLSFDALIYWQKAGELAARRSAFAEAEHHFTAGLNLLLGLPPTRENKEKELELRLALGSVLISTKGMAASEVSDNYTRAQELGRELEDFPRRFAALFGLWLYNMQVDSPTALNLSNDLLDLARRQGDSEYLLQAHHAAWTSSFFQGRLGANVEHSSLGWEIYDPVAHSDHAFTYGGHDPGVCSRTFSSCAQVLLGRVEQAERSLEEARELAKTLSHPASMGSALGFTAMAFQISGDATRALHYAESAIGHCEKAGLDRLLWKTASIVVRGWSLAILESDDAAFTEIERGIRQWTASGTTFCYPYLLGLLADAQGHLGRYDEAYSTALKALESSEQIGELWWRPELYRIIGHFQENISRDLVGDAETSFQNSIRSARGIDAKTLELRGSLSLARLWHSQGKTAEARDLLASVYGWFTEGFDTADLKEAKALLDALD